MHPLSFSRFRHRGLALVALALVSPVFADGPNPFIVQKDQLFGQTSAGGAVADAHTPFAFSAQAPSSATLHLPGGSTQPLGFQSVDNNYRFTTLFATKAALDAAFPNGTYPVTGTGIPTLTFNLPTDLYPTAVPQITSGTWSAGGVLLVNPAQATTLNISTFTTYNSAGVAGHESVSLDTETGKQQQDIATQAVLGLTASATPLNSFTIPAGVLTAGNVYHGSLDFDTITTLDTTTVPGNGVIALFKNHLEFWVAAVAGGTTAVPAPTVTAPPVNQTAPLGGTATFTATINYGQLVNFKALWYLNGVELSIAQNDPKYTLTFNSGVATLTIHSLTSADAGSYSFRAADVGGVVTTSAATLTLGTPGNVPKTPASLGAYASGATEVTLTWIPASDGSVPTGYRIERALDATFATGLQTGSLPAASTSYLDATVAPAATYYYRLTATNAAGASAPTNFVQVQTPATNGTGPSSFANIATRAYCSIGNNVTIGGFVVSGSSSKRVLVRAVGPSLTAQGIGPTELLADPTIEVHDAVRGNVVVASNDNLGDNLNAADIVNVSSLVGATALLGSDTKSAALLVTLSPGVYSFVVNGKGGTSGVVLLEVYDADPVPTGTTFANIATRADCTTGNGVTIGGFVIAGGQRQRVLLRAVGPTLTLQGLSTAEVLADPVIELHDALHGNVLIATNDDAGTNANADDLRTTGARIGASPLAASDTTSAALLLTLPPGVYSFIAHGKTAAPSGVVLVEVYDAN